MPKASFEQKLLILAIIFLPINRFCISIPIVEANIAHLFLLTGELFFVYKVIAGKEKLLDTERYFFCFLGVFTLWKCICSVLGIYEYSYYDLIRMDHFGKLNYLLQYLHSFGFEPDKIIAFKIWFGIRSVIMCITDMFLTYGVSAWVYHLYKSGSEEQEKRTLFFSHVLFAVCVLCLALITYSVVEIGYLRGSQYCADLLAKINPLLYRVKAFHGWWPPLLWPNQLRSLFTEPSYFGIGSSFIVPFLFYKMLAPKKNYLYFVLYGAFAVLLFMTRARTAVIIFVIQTVLLLVYAVGFNTNYIKKSLKILCISGVSFCVALTLMSGFKPVSSGLPSAKVDAASHVARPAATNTVSVDARIKSAQSAAAEYVKDNIASVVENKRSNTARFASVRAMFLTGIQHPVFGVGRGLSTAYVNDNFTEEDVRNAEVRNWSDCIQREGAFATSVPVLNEMAIEIAQYGIPGLLLYLLPVFFVLRHLLTWPPKGLAVEIACIVIAYLSSMAAMFSNTAFFTYYILTGIMLVLLCPVCNTQRTML